MCVSLAVSLGSSELILNSPRILKSSQRQKSRVPLMSPAFNQCLQRIGFKILTLRARAEMLSNLVEMRRAVYIISKGSWDFNHFASVSRTEWWSQSAELAEGWKYFQLWCPDLARLFWNHTWILDSGSRVSADRCWHRRMSGYMVGRKTSSSS